MTYTDYTYKFIFSRIYVIIIYVNKFNRLYKKKKLKFQRLTISLKLILKLMKS